MRWNIKEIVITWL